MKTAKHYADIKESTIHTMPGLVWHHHYNDFFEYWFIYVALTKKPYHKYLSEFINKHVGDFKIDDGWEGLHVPLCNLDTNTPTGSIIAFPKGNIPILAHECVHAEVACLRYIGVSNEEMSARLVGKLVEVGINGFKKHKT
jgi:hypothetical protein